LNFFITILESCNEYPKVRDLQKLLDPRLSPIKINTILRYLEKSKKLEIDLDGNIIWFQRGNTDNRVSFLESANFSPEFFKQFSTKDID
jgi:hypothetical protein